MGVGSTWWGAEMEFAARRLKKKEGRPPTESGPPHMKKAVRRCVTPSENHLAENKRRLRRMKVIAPMAAMTAVAGSGTPGV